MVQLNRIDLATEEDKIYGIDHWARLFKAKTWEGIKMLVENNEYLQETAEALYEANADEIVRQQCRARKDAEIREMRMEYAIRKLEKEVERKDKLTKYLMNASRYDDLKKALEDVAYREELYRELEL